MRPFLTVADCNEALPDSCGHRPVPSEVSAFFFLVTSIAMRTLRNLYRSIPFDGRIPMHWCPDAVRPLVEMLSKSLYVSSPGKYFQIGGYWVL